MLPSDEEILYVAQWAARRLNAEPDRRDELPVLAERMRAMLELLQRTPPQD